MSDPNVHRSTDISGGSPRSYLGMVFGWLNNWRVMQIKTQINIVVELEVEGKLGIYHIFNKQDHAFATKLQE